MRQINPDSADIISRSSSVTQEELPTSFNSSGITFIPEPPDFDPHWQPKEETQIIGRRSRLAGTPATPVHAVNPARRNMFGYVAGMQVAVWFKAP